MKHILIVLAMLALLVACGGEDDDSGLVSSGNTPPPNNETPTDAAVVADDSLALDEQGLVVYLQGEALMALVDGEPVLLADDVTEETLWPSPSRRRLLFATADEQGNRFPIHRIDPQTAAVDQIHEISGYLGSVSWSPDEEWLMLSFTVVGPVFVRHDGGAVVVANELMEERFSVMDRLWLADGTLLIGDGNFDPAAQSTDYDRIAQVDLAAPQVTILENPEDYDSLFGVAEEMGVVGQPFSREYHAQGGQRLQGDGGGFGPPPSLGACDPWQILHRGEVVYSVQDAYNLTEMTVADNGDLYFVQWIQPECRLSLTEPPQVSLMRLEDRNRAAAVIEDGLSPEFAPNREFSPFGGQMTRYALAPSGAQIVWIGGSINSGTTTLNVLDLESGTTRELVSSSISAPTGGGITRSVYWLARRAQGAN